MKKIAALVVALVCLAGFSVSSFAYNVVKPDNPNFTQYGLIKDNGDHYAINVVFPASRLNSDQLAFWNRFTSAYSVGSSSKAVLTYSNRSFSFWILDDPYVMTSYGSSVFIKKPGNNPAQICIPHLSYNTATDSFTGFSSACAACPVDYVFAGFAKVSGWPSVATYVDWNGKQLAITDDINEPEEPGEPEEPDPDPEPPESVPDTPKPPPYVPIEPGIPAGDGKYVLYDTGVWKTVINHIKGNMGAAANMGLLVFGFILIWSILRKIFHHFTKV